MTQGAGGASGKTRVRNAVAAPAAVTPSADLVDETALLSDLRCLEQSAGERIAAAVFATQCLLCWQLGQRLLRENLRGERAEYGKRILETVSRALAAEVKAWSARTVPVKLLSSYNAIQRLLPLQSAK